MQVTAKERGFYGAGLKEPGETFSLLKEEHYSDSWMVKGLEAPTQAPQKFAGYVAARGAAGKFVVKDAAGQMVGTFTGNKAEAEAEAARLNAGGELNPAPASDTPPPGDDGQDDDAGPDA